MCNDELVHTWLRTLLPRESSPPREPSATSSSCSALDWAASGGMALTGEPNGRPVLSPAAAFGVADAVTRRLAQLTADAGTRVEITAATALFGRSALAGFERAGQHSAGGASRLLRTADGWCAVTLARTDDFDAVPAVLGLSGWTGVPPPSPAPGDPTGAEELWAALESAASTQPAALLADRAQLLGIPAAALAAVGTWCGDEGLGEGSPPAYGARVADRRDRGPRGKPTRMVGAPHLEIPSGTATDAPALGSPPWRVSRIAEPATDLGLDGRLVVDLSSLWAGPLCGRLLGAAGARVVKVEGVHRPDGARSGDPRFFDWLHAGQEFRTVDFRSDCGRRELAALLDAADIVIEASRPRALAQLGLAPEERRHRAGRVWLSITGYGRAHPLRVAFGDDAAVAGGLVGWDGNRPVFCGDAIADPLTGLCGALAVVAAVRAGGGVLIDLSMRDTAAAFAGAPALAHGPHRVSARGSEWVVECPHLGREQPVLRPSPPVLAPIAATADGCRC